MRNLTKLILTTTLLFTGLGGVSSVKAEKVYANPSNGTQTWNAETSTFTWTAVSNAYINLGLPLGDISAYTKIHFNVNSITNAPNCRLVIKNGGKNDQLTVALTTGEHNVLLANYPAFDFSCVTSIELFSNASNDMGGFTIDQDNPASAVITDIYIEKPTSLVFDAYGKASINKTGFTATGGLSYEPSTGVLTSNGTEGKLILEFANPIDLSYLKHFNVTNSGSTGDILDRLEFYDEDGTKINTWSGIKLSNTWQPNGIDNNATNAFLNHKAVKKMVWPSDANDSKNGKTATITSVEFTLKTISCARAGETQLNTLAWIKIENSKTETPDWNMNGSSDTYYGNYSGDATHYADLTDYKELRVYCKDNKTGFRAFFINADASGTFQVPTSSSTWHPTEKYYSLDLSSITPKWGDKVALKSIKSDNNGGAPSEWNVTNIVVYNTPAANAPQYSLTGSGMQLAETTAALSDATATCIDATAVTGITTNSEAGRTLLESANPNCLFLGKVGNGYLANTKNVVDGSTCTNLVLTDGYPYKAPSDFTASAASYSTTINATAKAGTLCLPFAAGIPEGISAYTLEYTGGDEATATPVETTIPANTPVLLNGSGNNKEFTGSGVSIDADAANEKFALKGVFETGTVPEGSYVLQNGGDGVGFYQVTTDDPITIKPFRAYLTASATGARSISIVYADESAGISDVNADGGEFGSSHSDVYDLQGRRVSQTTKGLYIVNGKKVIK